MKKEVALLDRGLFCHLLWSKISKKFGRVIFRYLRKCLIKSLQGILTPLLIYSCHYKKFKFNLKASLQCKATKNEVTHFSMIKI